MKQLRKYIWLFLLPACYCLPACKKSNPLAFQAPAMVYIYKAPYALNTDSVIYSFAIHPDSVMMDTIKIPVRIIGMAAAQDREVILKAVADSTTATAGTDYTLLPYQIPAGAYTANLPVVIKRTTTMKKQTLRLLLEVEPSKDFLPGVPNSKGSSVVAGGTVRYLIKLNDYLTKPANWDTWLVYFFGSYSATKYKFVIQTTGIATFSTDMPYGVFSVYSTLCKQKLAEYEAANGPLIDENGDQVSFD
ncbi:uncharacterized protein DUF4843 [Chitinophaga niastensis]|uniref:Uncharacterized protein DUF4843 n=1 Tax=Chitinophaga niastensis TaxID=536980 RepID=A0A2P8HUE7_CHINA|nr:DUF4843 domain-containing protein [Chitinophaga niastensis]PSL49857.1 uncharacterized protein DUF4843 [Chitinophaga niastensis]